MASLVLRPCDSRAWPFLLPLPANVVCWNAERWELQSSGSTINHVCLRLGTLEVGLFPGTRGPMKYYSRPGR